MALQYWREVARSALSERIAFLECVSFSPCRFLLSVSMIFESLLAGENLQGLCPFKAASLPSVGSTRGGASRPQGLKSACSDPAFALVRTYLRRSLTLCSHFRSSASGFAPAFWWQRIELPLVLFRRRLNFALSLALTWSFAPGRCLTITRRAPTPRVLRKWLFSALKASSTPAVPMAFRAHNTPLPRSSTMANTHAFGLYYLALFSRHAGPRCLCPPPSAIANLPLPRFPAFLRVLIHPAWQPLDLKN